MLRLKTDPWRSVTQTTKLIRDVDSNLQMTGRLSSAHERSGFVLLGEHNTYLNEKPENLWHSSYVQHGH